MNSQLGIVAVNSTMAGVAGCYVAKQLGVGSSAWRFGLGIAALNIGSYIFINRVRQEFWVTPRQPLAVIYTSLKNRLAEMAEHRRFWKALILLGGGLSLSTRLGWAVRQGPLSTVSALGQTCIFGPIAHEILFRGFVQEKIQDIQVHVRTPGSPPDLQAEKRIRVLAQQAIIAVLVQASTPRRMRYELPLGFASIIPYGLGFIREDHGIQASLMVHSAASTLWVVSTLILGGQT